jgi:hypothetical protein
MADVAVVPPHMHNLYEAGKPAMTVVETVQALPQSNGVKSLESDTESPAPYRSGTKGYYRNEELGGPIHTERQMNIVVVGAGASGLCLAYKLQRSFSNFSLSVFEKNPEISGTWYENRC